MNKKLQLRVREYAKSVGLSDVLTSREMADKMLALALNELKCLESGMVIECSFKDIIICDTSFVDQFLLNLQLKIQSLDNVLMRLCCCSVGVLENISAALAYRNEKAKKSSQDIPRINLLLFQEGTYSILGHVENGMAQAFEFIQKISTGVTARTLVDTLGIEGGSNAANRLKKLYDLRLVCRLESIDETGRQFVYYIPE